MITDRPLDPVVLQGEVLALKARRMRGAERELRSVKGPEGRRAVEAGRPGTQSTPYTLNVSGGRSGSSDGGWSGLGCFSGRITEPRSLQSLVMNTHE